LIFYINPNPICNLTLTLTLILIQVRKGKKSVNNKIRKAAGLERHEKNSAKEQFGRDKRKRRRT
jgi:hypothetical protein